MSMHSYSLLSSYHYIVLLIIILYTVNILITLITLYIIIKIMLHSNIHYNNILYTDKQLGLVVVSAE